MKKCLAIVFLLIFSFQVLPVKEIGKLLFKNTNTEEEVHGSSGDNANKGKFNGEDLYLEYCSSKQEDQQNYFDCKLVIGVHAAYDLPPLRIEEVQSPPPDFSGNFI